MPPCPATVTRELVVPVIREGKVTEIMGVGNKDTDYVQQDVEAVQILASMVNDIVGRRRIEAALNDSEVRFRTLVEQAGDGFFVLDIQGNVRSVNTAACTQMGYSKEELVQLSMFDLAASPSREKFDRNLALIEKSSPIRYETVYRRRNGTTFPAEVTRSFVTMQGTRYLLTLVRDITERKEAEEKTQVAQEQLRELATRLSNVRETESLTLARELHDEIGQDLVAAKIDLDWINSKLPTDQKALKDRAKQAVETIEVAINSAVNIAARLRPPVLDDAGIIGGLEWQAQEFQNRFEIVCRVISNTSASSLKPEQDIALYRIVQEALTNVARHSAATQVEIRVCEEADCLTLTISDDGKGIGADELMDRKSIGLAGMKERALAIGARFAIEGFAEKGTVVTIEVPL